MIVKHSRLARICPVLLVLLFFAALSLPESAFANNAFQEGRVRSDVALSLKAQDGDPVQSGWVQTGGVYYYKAAAKNGANALCSDWKSDGLHYYGAQLDYAQRSLYNRLAQLGPDDPHLEFGSDAGISNQKAFYQVLEAVKMDYPTFRSWCSGVEQFTDNGDGTFNVNLNVWPGWSQYYQNLAFAEIERIVSNISEESDRYTRVRYLFDVLQTRAEYDPYFLLTEEKTLSYDHTLLGVMVGKSAVCEGFADAFKALCDAAGVPCIQVGNIEHAWNFVQMEDGKWYSVDCSISIGALYANDDIDLSGPVNEFMLLGSEEPNYTGNSNYSRSALFIGNQNSCTYVFPKLSENTYAYTGNVKRFGHEVTGDLHFDYGDARFLYAPNDDGETCTVTGYEGPCQGTLAIPTQVDAYTVTEIGDYAFAYMRGFTDISVPDSVKSIGRFAFAYCSGLSGTLKMGSELDSIGDFAFMGCSGISSIDFPVSLTSIGKGAFIGLTSFEGDLILPDTLTSIGDFAFAYGVMGIAAVHIPDNAPFSANWFENSSYETLDVGESNTMYQSVNGLLYNKAGTVLISCPKTYSGAVRILDTTTTIAECAFQECYYVTGDLILPDSIVSIGNFAFSYAGFRNGESGSGFDSISIPGGITVGRGAFNWVSFDTFTARGELGKCGKGAFNFFGSINHSGRIVTPCANSELIDHEKLNPELFTYDLEHASYANGKCPVCGGCEVHDWGDAEHCSMDDNVFRCMYTCKVCGATTAAAWGAPSYELSNNKKTCVARRECIGGGMADIVETAPVRTETSEAATCTHGGWKKLTASFDSIAFPALFSTTVAAPALGHSFTSYVSNRDASCTQDGTKTAVCNNGCGSTDTVDDVGSAIGHSWIESYTVDKSPTCTEMGSESIHCSVCGEKREGSERPISKIAHTWNKGKVILATTYNASGTRLYTCTVCGKTRTEQIPALKRISLEHARITVKSKVAYTGKALKPSPKVTVGGKSLTVGADYTVTYKSNTNVGTATIVITGKSAYTGTRTVTFKIIQAANTAKAAKTTVKKSYNANALKKKSQTITLPKVTTRFGKAAWKVTSKDKKKVLTLKNGKVQVKKSAKKGTYTIKLKACVAATKNWKAAYTKVVTVKITVK